MTTDLERRFFETFEIKQREYTQCTLMGCRYVYKNCNNCQFHNVYKVDYPQITDKHYLELICVYNRYDSPTISSASEIENLKMHILNSLIIIFEDKGTDELKQQVQALFKEG